VNMPTDVTPADIADSYAWGWKLGLKALAIYRDGSKQSQPLNTQSDAGKAKDKEDKASPRPRRERLPDTRHSLTHKFNVGGHEGYINVGLYPDGRPGELFITMAKEGSTIGGLMDAFGTAVSISLQYGVPLEALVNKFSHMRFEPMGHTTNPDIRIAKSVVDYIFRWMGIQFLPGYKEANSGILPGKTPAGADDDADSQKLPVAKKAGGQSTGQGTTAVSSTSTTPPAPTRSASEGANGTNGSHTNGSHANGNGTKRFDADMLERAGVAMKVDASGKTSGRNDQFAKFQLDAPSCDNCGSITVRNGNCYLCHNCGNSMGCS
jgi:ribonucleoside-diphosphate reductase alpha chain